MAALPWRWGERTTEERALDERRPVFPDAGLIAARVARLEREVLDPMGREIVALCRRHHA